MFYSNFITFNYNFEIATSMKPLLLGTFLMLLFIKTSAQWAELKGAGSNRFNGAINCMITDDSGNVYVGGDFTNTGGHYFISKYERISGKWFELGDPTSGGTPLDANGTVAKIASDSIGNIYAIGSFTNPKGRQYVAKWTKATNQWSKLPDLDSNLIVLEFRSILVDKSGSVYVSGFIYDSIGSYVAKWDGISWSKYGGYIPGYIGTYTTDFGPTTHLLMDDRNVLYAQNNGLILYNVDGTWTDAMWTTFWGSSIYAMAIDPDYNIYIGGWLIDDVTGCSVFKVDTKAKTISKLGKNRFASGASPIRAIAVRSSSEVYAAGSINDLGGICRCSPMAKKWNKDTDEWAQVGDGADTIATSLGVKCMVLDTFDKKGNLLAGGDLSNISSWTDSEFVAIYNAPCHSYFVVTPTTAPHSYILTSYCAGTGPLRYKWNWGDGSPIDTGSTPSHTYASPGYYQICVYVRDSLNCNSSFCMPSLTYLAKTTADMVYVNVEVGTDVKESVVIKKDFIVYPNPSTGSFNLISNILQKNATASITDLFGKLLFQQDLTFIDNKCSLAFSDLSGVFILEIRDSLGNLHRERIVIK